MAIFFFIENKEYRVQVSNRFSEMVTGYPTSLRSRFLVAFLGQTAEHHSGDVVIRGHFNRVCRINAKDPKTFMPSPGT